MSLQKPKSEAAQNSVPEFPDLAAMLAAMFVVPQNGGASDDMKRMFDNPNIVMTQIGELGRELFDKALAARATAKPQMLNAAVALLQNTDKGTGARADAIVKMGDAQFVAGCLLAMMYCGQSVMFKTMAVSVDFAAMQATVLQSTGLNLSPETLAAMREAVDAQAERFQAATAGAQSAPRA